MSNVVIPLHSHDLPAQIAEARAHLDSWLSCLEPPSQRSGLVQVLRLVSIDPLTYELSLRDRCYNEARTIL